MQGSDAAMLVESNDFLPWVKALIGTSHITRTAVCSCFECCFVNLLQGDIQHLSPKASMVCFRPRSCYEYREHVREPPYMCRTSTRDPASGHGHSALLYFYLPSCCCIRVARLSAASGARYGAKWRAMPSRQIVSFSRPADSFHDAARVIFYFLFDFIDVSLLVLRLSIGSRVLVKRFRVLPSLPLSPCTHSWGRVLLPGRHRVRSTYILPARRPADYWAGILERVWSG